MSTTTEPSKIGKGISQIQIDAVKFALDLKPVGDLVQSLFDQWESINRFSSVHGSYFLFDPLYAYGEKALRSLFVLLRGAKNPHGLFGPINIIIDKLGMEKIEIPDEDCGRVAAIVDRYLAWAEKHLAPSLAELNWSAMLLQQKANEFWDYVTLPDPECNYGGAYFTGSLNQARDYDNAYFALRNRIKIELEAQAGQWRDAK